MQDAKDKLKKYAKKKIGKAIRKAVMKLIKKLLMKLITAVIKAILTAITALIGAIGIPTAIILAIVVILGGAMFYLAPSLGLIDGDSPRIQASIKSELESLIKKSSTYENYRPPFELVSSIDLMRIIQEDKNPWEVNFSPIVTTLSPDLTHETYQDTYEIKTVTTTTTEVTTYETRVETYQERVLVGYEKVFVCTDEEAAGLPYNVVIKKCYKEEPVYEWVEKTRTTQVPVTETVTDVKEEVKQEKKNVTFLKTAHTWNRFETYYYVENQLNNSFERIEVKQEGNKKVEIYKRKTKEWVFDRKDFQYNYTKFDKILTDLKLDDSAIQLLVEALKENNVPLDGYMGTFFDSFLEGGTSMMVPQDHMKIYQAAEKRFGVGWNYLAAIHYIETKFSTIELMVSSAGAIGHMQFMPCTWIGWAHPTCEGKGKVDIPISDLRSPAMVSQYRGLAIDAQPDGKTDPWDMEDAVFSAANLLSRNGFANNKNSAIFKYNNSEKYVADVNHYAELFKGTQGNIPPVSDGSFMRPALGPITSGFGMRWGKLHKGVDIGKNGDVTPIVAAASGVVSRSEVSSSYGEVVYIKHNIDGQVWETVYAHMVSGSRRVKLGDMVQKGQVIGIMGMTGDSTGVHLHFEMYPGGRGVGQPIDPVASGLIKW